MLIQSKHATHQRTPPCYRIHFRSTARGRLDDTGAAVILRGPELPLFDLVTPLRGTGRSGLVTAHRCVPPKTGETNHGCTDKRLGLGRSGLSDMTIRQGTSAAYREQLCVCVISLPRNPVFRAIAH